MNFSITEFRKNIRAALDAVDRGEEVVITRHDKAYLIVHSATYGKEVTHTFKVQTKKDDEDYHLVPPEKNNSLATPKKQKPTPAQMIPEVMVDKMLCPHGYARGFCKKADCNRKYAK